MIEVREARYRWPGASSDCLRIDSLSLGAGHSMFLHGPSGSGKSTLLGLLAGVLVPASGDVTLLGTRLKDLSPAGRDAFRADHVGYIFQQFNLLPYLSVEENVTMACRFSRARHVRAAAEAGSVASSARALLAGVGLEEGLWARKAAELSVGQQQRVAAARALIGRPDVVIADEPTSALDAATRSGFMHLLLSECARANSALVFVSHDERLAAEFDHVVSLPSINRAAAAIVSEGTAL